MFFMSHLSILLLFQVKRLSFHLSNQGRNIHRSSTVYKQKEMFVDIDVRGQQRMDFFTRRIFMDFGQKWRVKVKRALMMDLFLKNM